MRILFLPLITRGSAIGTISRCLAIAEILREKGHFVSFVIGESAIRHVEKAGFEYQIGPMPDPPGPLRPLRNLADVALFLNLTNENYVRRSFENERLAIDRFTPDVLFSEFKLTAPISAARAGLPLVSTACTPAHPEFVSPLFPETGKADDDSVRGFNHLLEEEGFSPVQDVAELFFMRSNLKIVPSSRELEPLLQGIEDLHYVGYLLYDRWERAALPPGLRQAVTVPHLIYAYFSMGEIGPDKYVEVLPRAFDETEFHLVVATGSHPDLPALPEATANVSFFRMVPGISVLDRSDAVIFHGGQNTAMASLLHGVPSLIFSGSDFERDFNARGMARVGAGMHMKTDDFTPDRLIRSVRGLVRGDYGRNAYAHGQGLRQLGGPMRAADLILKAAE